MTEFTFQKANNLLDVARALREAPKPLAKKFKMAFFGYTAKKGCGTPACALGHYAARRDLQKVCRLDRFNFVRWAGTEDTGFNCPACRDHFGITYLEAEEIFGGAGCGEAPDGQPLVAAAYIEKFVIEKARRLLVPPVVPVYNDPVLLEISRLIVRVADHQLIKPLKISWWSATEKKVARPRAA